MIELSRCGVVKKGKILLLYRKKHEEWVFPGGKLDVNESKENTAIRETKEETGCDVKIKKFVCSEEFSFGPKNFKQYIFLVEMKGTPKIMEPEEFSEIMWINIEDYKKYPVSPHVVIFCEYFLKNQTK